MDTRLDICADFGIVLDKLFSDIRKGIQAYKEFLPKRGKKLDYPHILWIEAPLHNHYSKVFNEHCKKFNEALKLVATRVTGVSVLQLKKVWDPENAKLYLREQQRLTADGIMTYWMAVENTVRYCLVVLDQQKSKYRYANVNRKSVSDTTHQLPGAMYHDYKKKNHKTYHEVKHSCYKLDNRCKMPTPPRRSYNRCHLEFYTDSDSSATK